jgi:hypothetical protein
LLKWEFSPPQRQQIQQILIFILFRSEKNPLKKLLRDKLYVGAWLYDVGMKIVMSDSRGVWNLRVPIKIAMVICEK